MLVLKGIIEFNDGSNTLALMIACDMDDTSSHFHIRIETSSNIDDDLQPSDHMRCILSDPEYIKFGLEKVVSMKCRRAMKIDPADLGTR